MKLKISKRSRAGLPSAVTSTSAARRPAVLLRLAYLGVANAFVLLRLLPMSDWDKDVEISALRHQITVLERQLGGDRPWFFPGDRAFLAALLHRLPVDTLRQLRLLVRPETVLRWHRDLIARRHAARSRPKRPGRPRTIRSIRLLVLRLARENSAWGYRRIHGELLVLGIKVAASTVWQILKDAGIDPAAKRTSTTWSAFLRSQADALLACDFFETSTLIGTRQYVLAVIEHASRRIRILGATTHLTAAWVTQAARNLAMDLEDAGSSMRYLIRDRDGKYPALFDAVLADAGIQVVFTGVRIPRMNAIMERWIRSCRRELLDRTLIWNQRHLLHALREYEHFYNTHRPHQGIAKRPTTTCATTVSHRSSSRNPTRHPSTAAAWRHPQRVSPRRLTCTDDIFGKHRVVPATVRTRNPSG
ncbi:integrase core domain-containing protein [Saccharothrix sp. NRRL B-16348]|uniref:integrase core domain-containing protein n=1 Tax=Saccharothrix sp. NRRL B-16348 TaxID=1415542 RepID=UPI000A503298|nr:integrase core domain-containing protein [Saccharothrix sp. NRRL B-16348]